MTCFHLNAADGKVKGNRIYGWGRQAGWGNHSSSNYSFKLPSVTQLNEP